MQMVFIQRWIFLLVLGLLPAAPVPTQPLATSAQKTSTVPVTSPAAAPSGNLSAAQLQKIKEILAPYKLAKLSPDDAKLIKRQLRDAGMRPSPALEDAMRAAGFPLQKLDELDPRPPGPAPDALPAVINPVTASRPASNKH